MPHLRYFLAIVIASGLFNAAGSAFAQPPVGQPGGAPPQGPVQSPAFSPYLNLSRQGTSGTSSGINYFGIVRPQSQFASSIISLQNQANQINPYTAGTAGGEQAVVTGNAFGFQNHRNYFQNQYIAGGFGNATSIGFGRTGATSFGAPGTTLPGAATGQKEAAPATPRR